MKQNEIEKNIPIPPVNTRVREDDTYPLRHMEVNDSFYTEAKTFEDKQKIRSYLQAYGNINEVRFITRSVNDGIRVWRVE